MLKRILLSHSPAYFFVIPLLSFVLVYAAYPMLNKTIEPFPGIFNFDILELPGDPLLATIMWFIPFVLTAMFIPMLTSRFGMFEKGMFLNSILWLMMSTAFMFFSGNYYTVLASVAILPCYYFIFGMYKSEYPVHLFFNASFFVSVASMFYLPALVFIPLIWIGWLFNNPFSFRAYFVSITGLIAPFILVFSYLFLTDQIENLKVDTSFLNYNDKSLKQDELIFIAFTVFFTLIGIIRLIAPGSVKKIGLRKNFNFSLLVFAFIISATLFFKMDSLLIFAFFPASIIANISLSWSSKGWTFVLLFVLYLGLMFYYPFWLQMFG